MKEDLEVCCFVIVVIEGDLYVLMVTLLTYY